MLVELMDMPDVPTPINTGTGSDVSIRELAETIIDVIGYRGVLSWDTTKPDGMPRKLMDSSVMIGMGVAPRIGLRDGLALTYRWFVDNYDEMAKSKQA
jgi:GDP-L-fucose synthase